VNISISEHVSASISVCEVEPGEAESEVP